MMRTKYKEQPPKEEPKEESMESTMRRNTMRIANKRDCMRMRTKEGREYLALELV